jgi:hypothetical protein
MALMLEGGLDSRGVTLILLTMPSALRKPERPARRFDPCLPRPAKKPPAGTGWIHEIKHDGFRIVAHRDGDRVRLVTRNGFQLAFRMANVLAFAIVGALFACPLATFAQSPPGPAGPVTASPRSGWSIIEDKSAPGKSAQFSAGTIMGDAALILRCREQRTEAAFSTEDTYLGEETVKVRYRIDLNEPIQQTWRSSINGRAAFAPKPMDLIRALPDNGRIFIRAIASDGNNKDANFIISGTSAIRDKIARACNWPATSEEPVESIPTPKER